MTLNNRKIIFTIFNRCFDTIEDAINYCNACDFSIEFIQAEEV